MVLKCYMFCGPSFCGGKIIDYGEIRIFFEVDSVIITEGY